MQKKKYLPYLILFAFFWADAVLASPGNNPFFHTQWQNQIQSQQALSQIEKNLQIAYDAARKALGEKNWEATQLEKEQENWDKNRHAKALSAGAPGSPAYNQELINLAKDRIRLLDAITAKGRVLAYHQYQLAPGQVMTGFMRIWQYEDGHAHVIISTQHESKPIGCEINTESAHHKNGSVTFSVSGSRSITGSIVPYDNGYRANVETADHTGYCPADADLAGQYIRTDIPIQTDHPGFEKITSCPLGEDKSQTIHILRSQPISNSHIYYVEDARGLWPLSMYAGENTVKPYEALEYARGSQVRARCVGEKEKILLVTGEFWSNFIHIFAFRYNSSHNEWQILYTEQRDEPLLIYLNNEEMQLIIPNPADSASKKYRVRSHIIGKGYIRYDDQGKQLDSDTLPDPDGFSVTSVREDASYE